MEFEPRSGSAQNPEVHIHSSPDGGYPMIKAKMSSLSSSSSSSSSSFDPLMDSDDDEKDGLDNSIAKLRQGDTSSPSARVAMSLEVPSAQAPEWSMVSVSPRAGLGPMSSAELSPGNPEWSTISASSVRQSPPIQMMGRPGTAYEPNRIPSSIFASKSGTPMEWSVASNESLFSIHMGNNSFSRDFAFLSKSGELTKPDDLGNFTPTQQPIIEAKSNEFSNPPSTLPTVHEVVADDHGKSANGGDDSEVKEAADENPKVAPEETAQDHSKDKVCPPEAVRLSTSASNSSDGKEAPQTDGPRTFASPPRLSDESGNSSRSFAFPVLGGSEGGRSSSVTAVPEASHPKPPDKPDATQPEAQLVTPKASNPPRNRWLCFSCYPVCW